MTSEQQYRLNALKQLIATNGEDVFINGKTCRGFVEDITHDEALMSGGIIEAGGFRATIPISDLADKPDKGADISARGKQLEVVSVTEHNGVSYEITAGSLLAEEA